MIFSSRKAQRQQLLEDSHKVYSHPKARHDDDATDTEESLLPFSYIWQEFFFIRLHQGWVYVDDMCFVFRHEESVIFIFCLQLLSRSFHSVFIRLEDILSHGISKKIASVHELSTFKQTKLATYPGS